MKRGQSLLLFWNLPPSGSTVCISNELSRSCRCFRFHVVSRNRVLICRQQQGCCALYEQVVQTPTAWWQNYRGGMPLACRVPAVNEGLQHVVMINGMALSHFIDFTCSAISGCRFTAVQTGRRIKGHVKTIWRSPQTCTTQTVTSFHAKITQFCDYTDHIQVCWRWSVLWSWCSYKNQFPQPTLTSPLVHWPKKCFFLSCFHFPWFFFLLFDQFCTPLHQGLCH